MSEIEITIEGTPNPDALKFVLNSPVQYNGTSTFLDVSECESVPMARALLELDGVLSVFFMDRFVTISKESAVSWNRLTTPIESVIREMMPAHDPAIVPQKVDATKLTSDERLIRIEAILDRDIRPGLASDGGGLEILSLEGNVLNVKYQGACGSCPSSQTGTLMAIQDLLRRQFDASLEVRAGSTGDDSPFTSLFKAF